MKSQRAFYRWISNEVLVLYYYFSCFLCCWSQEHLSGDPHLSIMASCTLQMSLTHWNLCTESPKSLTPLFLFSVIVTFTWLNSSCNSAFYCEGSCAWFPVCTCVCVYLCVLMQLQIKVSDAAEYLLSVGVPRPVCCLSNDRRSSNYWHATPHRSHDHTASHNIWLDTHTIINCLNY